jgi:predicted small lipoprotein YifL
VRIGCYSAELDDFSDAFLVGTVTMEAQGDELQLEMQPSSEGMQFSITLTDPVTGHYESAQFDPDQARARAEEPSEEPSEEPVEQGEPSEDYLEGTPLGIDEPDESGDEPATTSDEAADFGDEQIQLEDESLEGLEFDQDLEQELNQIETEPAEDGAENDVSQEDLSFPDDLYEGDIDEDDTEINFSQDLEEALAENPMEALESSGDDDSGIWSAPSELTDDLEADLESEWQEEDRYAEETKPFRPLLFFGYLLAALAALIGLSYLVFVGLKGPEYPPLEKVAVSSIEKVADSDTQAP